MFDSPALEKKESLIGFLEKITFSLLQYKFCLYFFIFMSLIFKVLLDLYAFSP